MKHISAGLLLLGASWVLISCTRTVNFDAAEVRKSIDAENAKYCQAIRQGDAAGAAATYTESATILPPDGPMVKGKAAVEDECRRMLQMGIKDITLKTLEVGGGGDAAYEIGVAKVLIQLEGRPAISDSSKYLVIWKRQADGGWKVDVDMWNFNMSMPGM